MPYTTTLEAHGLLTEWRGHATNAEMVQMQEQVHRHPKFDVVRYSIHDFSKCDSFAPDNDDVEFLSFRLSFSSSSVVGVGVGASLRFVRFVRAFV